MILESSSIPTSLSTSSAPSAAILVATAYFSHSLFVKDSELFHPCFIGRSLLITSRPLRDTNEVFLVGGFALWRDIDSKQVVSSALTLVPKFTVFVNSPVEGLEPFATRKVRAVVGFTVTDTDVAAYFSVSQVNFFICPFQLVQLLGHSPILVAILVTRLAKPRLLPLASRHYRLRTVSSSYYHYQILLVSDFSCNPDQFVDLSGCFLLITITYQTIPV